MAECTAKTGNSCVYAQCICSYENSAKKRYKNLVAISTLVSTSASKLGVASKMTDPGFVQYVTTVSFLLLSCECF